MTDDGEEVVEAGAVERDTRSDVATGGSQRPLDEAAESFLALEDELAEGEGDGLVRGRAVDVERVPASEVPEGYPVSVGTGEALALAVDVDGGEAVVYFEWDGGSPDDRLARLLALRGIPAERFGDLHGEYVALRVENGYHVPCVPDEPPRGRNGAVYGVVAGLGLNLLALLSPAVGLGGVFASVPAVVGLLAVNLVGLPLATYLDAWHLRTHTDWEQGPAFWALLAAVPGVNVLTTALYLWLRRQATPL